MPLLYLLFCNSSCFERFTWLKNILQQKICEIKYGISTHFSCRSVRNWVCSSFSLSIFILKQRISTRNMTKISVTKEKLHWWLVRVTLVVDWLFLPQNFGPVVGTYEGLLRLSECTWGSVSIFRWWGHLTTICTNRTFSCRRWWGP